MGKEKPELNKSMPLPAVITRVSVIGTCNALILFS
jgi:hypothetical protein